MEGILTKEDFGVGKVAKVLKDGDTYVYGWGLELAVITDEDIKALQEGKALIFDVLEEYSILLTKREV